MAEAKPDVISVDWNADLATLKQSLPKGIAVQGNLDPPILYASTPVIKERIHRLFDRMREQDGFVSNHGHGIMPDMLFDHIKHAVAVRSEHSIDRKWCARSITSRW